MTTHAEPAAPSDRAPRRTATWLVATIAAAAGLFYAYAVWNAVGFLVAQATGPLGLNGLGWVVLLLPVVLPMAVFAAAFALGFRRRAWQLALLLVAGLGVVAVFWLNIVAYAAAYGARLLA